MGVFTHFLCIFILSRTTILSQAFILEKNGDPCASSLLFETEVNPSQAGHFNERRINNPYVPVNPSEEEAEFRNTIKNQYDLEVNDYDESLGKRASSENVIQFEINAPATKRKLINRRRIFQPLIKFDEHSRSLLCPRTIQAEVEVNPGNLQPGANLNRAMELDLKTNPLDSPEFEAAENSIRFYFRKLKSKSQIILRTRSSEQNTIKPEANYIYLFLPKNESIHLWDNRQQAGADGELSGSGVNPVEINSGKGFLETKLESTDEAGAVRTVHSDEENGYELKADESEKEFDSKEIDLSFLKYAQFRRRH